MTVRELPMRETQEWLPVSEVAARLHVHPNTVRRLIKNGRLTASRPGGPTGQIRVNTADLDRFMRACRTDQPDQTTSDPNQPAD
jgi:excisionase family DNA binding protein